MTNEPELIRLLLSSGAKPTSYFPHHLRDNPTDMAIKMFVLGNPGAGKSTFVKAFSTEGQGFRFRIKHQFTKVRDVDEKTAGIIPHDIISKALGRLSLYDFAGHKEYYAGHDALLHNTMTNSPSIVTLVVDMRDEEGKIRETLQYWFQFINNHSSEGGAKPHLLIISSHADVIPSSEARQKSKFIESVASSYNFDSVTFAGQIVIDCRYAESSSMTKVRSILSQICHTLRSSEEIAAAHHSFLVFLLHRFGDQLAVTFSDAVTELRRNLNSHDHMYLECIKSSDPFEVCVKLNERGNILFMKKKEHRLKSWIVLDKAILLSKVNGVIFAPEGFKEHQKNLSTSTGVVPLSKLAPLFPNVDLDMITQFLCHLEFCQEIKDVGLVSLLATEGQSSPTADEQYLFFPGLVHLDTPQDVIASSTSNLDYNSGWVLQCSKSEQFFSSRFLQVLLLRLAFLFALAPTDPSTTDHLALHRKCSVWKNGIYWVNRSGGEAIVEIINLRQVVVIVRSKLEKMELVRLRSAVVKTVTDAKEEFCSKVLVRESLILPEDTAVYPLDPSKVTGISITEVAATIMEGEKFVVNEKNQTIELEKMIYFEPYAYLGEPLLQKLFSEDIIDGQEITDEHFIDIATERSHKSIDEYCTILELKIERASHKGLLQVFQLWRDKMGKEGTRKNFKKKLDQFSVFAGRNPLKLITGTNYCVCTVMTGFYFGGGGGGGGGAGAFARYACHLPLPPIPILLSPSNVFFKRNTVYPFVFPPSININISATANSSTNPADLTIKNSSQYRESDSAASISIGMLHYT